MKRVEGISDVALIECINPVKNRWYVRWDVKTEDNRTTYMEEMFTLKPSPGEIKSMIFGWYNSEINARILGGFIWNDIPVWLSSENQSNFKTAYDLAFQTTGANLPIKFKLGENLEGNPVYFTFEDLETFTDFYTKAITHIQNTLAIGWEMKDAFLARLNQH